MKKQATTKTDATPSKAEATLAAAKKGEVINILDLVDETKAPVSKTPARKGRKADGKGTPAADAAPEFDDTALPSKFDKLDKPQSLVKGKPAVTGNVIVDDLTAAREKAKLEAAKAKAKRNPTKQTAKQAAEVLNAAPTEAVPTLDTMGELIPLPAGDKATYKVQYKGAKPKTPTVMIDGIEYTVVSALLNMAYLNETHPFVPPEVPPMPMPAESSGEGTPQAGDSEDSDDAGQPDEQGEGETDAEQDSDEDETTDEEGNDIAEVDLTQAECDVMNMILDKFDMIVSPKYPQVKLIPAKLPKLGAAKTEALKDLIEDGVVRVAPNDAGHSLSEKGMQMVGTSYRDIEKDVLREWLEAHPEDAQQDEDETEGERKHLKTNPTKQTSKSKTSKVTA